MATIADQLLGIAAQTQQNQPDLAGSFAKGAQLGLQAEQVQQQRAELEVKKQELQQQRLQKFSDDVSKIHQFKDASARKGYIQFLKSQNQQLKLGIPDEALDFAFASPENIARVATLQDMTLRGDITGEQAVAIMTDYAKFAEILPKNKFSSYKGPTFEAGGKMTPEEIEQAAPQIFEAAKARQGNLAQQNKATAASTTSNREDKDNLRKELTGHDITKNTRVVNDYYGRMQQGFSGKPSAAGDMSAIFAYMKLLDPNSTVREGEYASAKNAGGVEDRIQAAYNSAVDGQLLSPEQRKDFFSRAGKIKAAQEAQQQELNQKYVDLATQRGYDPKEILAGQQTIKPKLTWQEQIKRDKKTIKAAKPAEQEEFIKNLSKRTGVSEDLIRKELEGE